MSHSPAAADARPLAILYTGGTFGMRPGPRGLEASPELRAEVAAVLDAAASAPPWIYRQTAQPIDSSELGPRLMSEVADQIRAIVDADRPRGIVVIHGTDTLAHSAAFTAFALGDLTTPVVFTGSQLPLGVIRSDAAGNLLRAVEAASSPRRTGVTIAFGDELLPAVRATKHSSVSLSAFSAPRSLAAPARGIDDALASSLTRAAGRTAPRIGLVRASPGLGPRQLRAALEESPDALVLECYGSGTAPVTTSELFEPLREAAERGTAILAITQCLDGAVELDRYAVGAGLRDAGVLSGADMTAEAALGKLAALLRAGCTGDRLRGLLAVNLMGERHAD